MISSGVWNFPIPGGQSFDAAFRYRRKECREASQCDDSQPAFTVSHKVAQKVHESQRPLVCNKWCQLNRLVLGWFLAELNNRGSYVAKRTRCTRTGKDLYGSTAQHVWLFPGSQRLLLIEWRTMLPTMRAMGCEYQLMDHPPKLQSSNRLLFRGT